MSWVLGVLLGAGVAVVGVGAVLRELVSAYPEREDCDCGRH